MSVDVIADPIDLQDIPDINDLPDESSLDPVPIVLGKGELDFSEVQQDYSMARENLNKFNIPTSLTENSVDTDDSFDIFNIIKNDHSSGYVIVMRHLVDHLGKNWPDEIKNQFPLVRNPDDGSEAFIDFTQTLTCTEDKKEEYKETVDQMLSYISEEANLQRLIILKRSSDYAQQNPITPEDILIKQDQERKAKDEYEELGRLIESVDQNQDLDPEFKKDFKKYILESKPADRLNLLNELNEFGQAQTVTETDNSNQAYVKYQEQFQNFDVKFFNKYKNVLRDLMANDPVMNRVMRIKLDQTQLEYIDLTLEQKMKVDKQEEKDQAEIEAHDENDARNEAKRRADEAKRIDMEGWLIGEVGFYSLGEETKRTIVATYDKDIDLITKNADLLGFNDSDIQTIKFDLQNPHLSSQSDYYIKIQPAIDKILNSKDLDYQVQNQISKSLNRIRQFLELGEHGNVKIEHLFQGADEVALLELAMQMRITKQEFLASNNDENKSLSIVENVKLALKVLTTKDGSKENLQALSPQIQGLIDVFFQKDAQNNVDNRPQAEKPVDLDKALRVLGIMALNQEELFSTLDKELQGSFVNQLLRKSKNNLNSEQVLSGLNWTEEQLVIIENLYDNFGTSREQIQQDKNELLTDKEGDLKVKDIQEAQQALLDGDIRKMAELLVKDENTLDQLKNLGKEYLDKYGPDWLTDEKARSEFLIDAVSKLSDVSLAVAAGFLAVMAISVVALGVGSQMLGGGR